MHILIATAGVLPPGPVADLARRCAGDDGHATVMTVVEVPHDFLETIEAEGWHPFDDGGSPAEVRAEVIGSYVEERGLRVLDPMLRALQARGVSAEPFYADGADAAQAIVDAAEEIEADLIIMGTTRQIFAEGTWASVSMRVMEATRHPLLLVPSAPTEHVEDEQDLISSES